MTLRKTWLAATAGALAIALAGGATAADISAGKLKALKAEAVAGVERDPAQADG